LKKRRTKQKLPGKYYYWANIITGKRRKTKALNEKGRKLYKGIITGAQIIRETLYKTKVIGEVLLLNRYCYRINFIKRKPSYYYRRNAAEYYYWNVYYKDRYYYRGIVVKRKP